MFYLTEKNDNNCWWCNNIADSREHKYKQTDILLEFGAQSELIRFNKDSTKYVQGPNSKLLKFEKNLCAECNNSKSQSMDFAYAEYSSFLKSNRSSIIDKGHLDFIDVFGHLFLEKKREVFRYFLKHVCCRLSSNSIHIPDEYKDFLNGGLIMNGISFRLCLNQELINIVGDNTSFIGTDPLMSNLMEDSSITYVYSSYNIGVFKLQYLCSVGFHDGQHSDYINYQNHSKIALNKNEYKNLEILEMMDYDYFSRILIN